MLVLSRKPGESIVIAGDIVVTILEVHGNRVRVGIEAPLDVSIQRQEIRTSVAHTFGREPLVSCLA